MTSLVLVLNTGSSSVKLAAYAGAERRLRVSLTGIGAGKRAALDVSEDPGGLLRDLPEVPDLPPQGLPGWLLDVLADRLGPVAAVGHRIVHGGRKYAAPVVLDDAVLADLRRLIPLAPLHEPHNLNGVEAAKKVWPGALQIGCFDTAFHRTQPELNQRLPIPRDLHDDGIQRYGFHGLSYDYIAGTLPEHVGDRARGRVIVAHLGNGASLCALRDGKSVATTMGMTALDGLMMGTRTGSIDPGVILHLIEERGMTPAEVSALLYSGSGLKGVSGLSGDLRTLEAAGTPAADEAMALFALRARQEIGAMAATIGGLDLLVFTGGIGEHSAPMRARICAGLDWLGIALDVAANARHGTEIQRAGASVKVLVLRTDEEAVIARATLALAASR
jgi:acetate kinase